MLSYSEQICFFSLKMVLCCKVIGKATELSINITYSYVA